MSRRRHGRPERADSWAISGICCPRKREQPGISLSNGPKICRVEFYILHIPSFGPVPHIQQVTIERKKCLWPHGAFISKLNILYIYGVDLLHVDEGHLPATLAIAILLTIKIPQCVIYLFAQSLFDHYGMGGWFAWKPAISEICL